MRCFVNINGGDMKEVITLRIWTEYSSRLFKPDEGRDLGTDSVREFSLDMKDPRIAELRELQIATRIERGFGIISWWRIKREYTPDELNRASLFRLRGLPIFEPAGEECGTEYDEATACCSCGAGRVLAGPLRLHASRMPRKKDIALTIAGELVVSERFCEFLTRRNMKGIHVQPVLNGRKGAEIQGWKHLVFRNEYAEVMPPTQAGIDPFDYDAEGTYRCPEGDTLGLNLISELTVAGATLPDSDIIATKQFFGQKMGLLRPERQLLVRPATYAAMKDSHLKGFKFEIAHVA